MVLNRGKIIADEPKDALMARLGNWVDMALLCDEKAVAALSQFAPHVRDDGRVHVRVAKAEVPNVFDTLRDAGVPLHDFDLQQARLEDAFKTIVS